LLRRADAVIVNGQSGASYIRRFGVEPRRLFIAPQTTDLEPLLALDAQRPKETRHRLLYCGALSERKGVLPFLACLEEWARRHPQRRVEFRIAGDGPLRTAIANRAAPANLHVSLLGPVPYEKLPEVYGDSGILVFPTLADEWGMVVTEAMASGAVVLGSRHGQAVEELIRDGETGWVFQTDDIGQMDRAVEMALNTPAQQIDRMAAKARLAVAKHSISAVADRVMTAVEYAFSSRFSRDHSRP
jgi:hypothetical protein